MSPLRMIGMLLVCAGLGYLVWLDNMSGDADVPPARINHAENNLPAPQPDSSVLESTSTGVGEEPAARAPDSGGQESADHTANEEQFANPLDSVDISALSDTVERPLFASSRQRPPPKAEAADKGDKSPVTFELLGVVVNGPRATAVLRRKQTGANFTVEAGDTLSGWRVSRIEQSSVVLEGPEGAVETIKLLRN
jgi:hypothetical protein